MREVRYRVSVPCDDTCVDRPCPIRHEVDLEVDDLQRLRPIEFAAWAGQDPASWNGSDQAWLDRVVLAAAYEDPDRAWRLAADALRVAKIPDLGPAYKFLAADVEARIPHAIGLALSVVLSVREAALLGAWIDPALAAEARLDTIAAARLRALVEVLS